MRGSSIQTLVTPVQILYRSLEEFQVEIVCRIYFLASNSQIKERFSKMLAR